MQRRCAMAKTIANQLSPSQVLGRAATLLRLLEEDGLPYDAWQLPIDAPQKRRLLVTYWAAGMPPPLALPCIHDAKTVCDTLGFHNTCKEKEVPKAADGEVVVWYGGWTLDELVTTGKVVNYLSSERGAWKAPAGYYLTRIPVPESNRMTPDEHVEFLAQQYAALKELPTPVGAVALAVHLGVTGQDLLRGNFCACAEALPRGRRAALHVGAGRVRVAGWDGGRYADVFLGAARQS
ncbi:MAG: hypothetical protein V1926_03695 [Candidatus Peregrinibacteria bacterium]